MKILLVCAAGMSTSLLVRKIQKAMPNESVDWIVSSQPAENLDLYIDEYDVILLGPQISHRLKGIQKEFAHKHKIIELLNYVDYGLGNGENIIRFVKSKL